MDGRKYLDVVANYMPDGKVVPVSIRFVGGAAYDISDITDEVDFAVIGKGSTGIRYCVVIDGMPHYLFLEGSGLCEMPRWYVRD